MYDGSPVAEIVWGVLVLGLGDYARHESVKWIKQIAFLLGYIKSMIQAVDSDSAEDAC